jgi:hypothetical protein
VEFVHACWLPVYAASLTGEAVLMSIERILSLKPPVSLENTSRALKYETFLFVKSFFYITYYFN